MSAMFEVYYEPPADARRESEWSALAESFGGRLDFREDAGGFAGICLTYEFVDSTGAATAAREFRKRGLHVEGPVEYAV